MVMRKGGAPMSRTNIDLEDSLVKKGMKLYKFRTKKELVNFALREAVRLAQQKSLLGLRGKVKWFGSLEQMRSLRSGPISTKRP